MSKSSRSNMPPLNDRLPPFSMIDLPLRQVFGHGYISGFFCNLRRRIVVTSSQQQQNTAALSPVHASSYTSSSGVVHDHRDNKVGTRNQQQHHADAGSALYSNNSDSDGNTAYDMLETAPTSWASRFGDLQLDFLNCIKIDGLSGPLAVEDPFGVIEESLRGELSLTNAYGIDGLSAKLCSDFNSAHGLSTLALDTSYARRWYHLHHRFEHRAPSSDLFLSADCNVKFLPNIYTGVQVNFNATTARIDDVWYKTALYSHNASSLMTLAFKHPKHFEAAVYHRPTYTKLEMGIVYGYKLGDSECDLAVGIKVGDETVDGSCVRAKLNNKSQLGVSLSSIVGAGRVVVSALLNTRQIDNFTAHHFGIGFEV